MAEPPPISAVLITLNAERHLERVLAALSWCDEVLVLDSGSVDRTCAIARASGARVEHQDFLGFGRQKQRAVDLARNDWVLVVDADEVLEPGAAERITALDRGDARCAWRLRRRTFVGGREVRWGIWSPDYSLRLFHRHHGRFSDAPVHESVATDGPVMDLRAAFLHYSYRDYADVFARMGSYARLKSETYRARGRRCGALRLLARAVWGFLRSYILKLGILDGNAGVIVALSLALDSVLALAIASEPDHGGPAPPARSVGPTSPDGVP